MQIPNDPDSVLVAKAQGGDQIAFSTLVTKYQHPIAKLLHGYLGNRQDVEDALQEVFLRTWKTIKAFEGRSKFFTWLYRIAMNVGLTYRAKTVKRQYKRMDNEEHEQDEPIFADSSFDPQSQVKNDNLAKAINKALSGLSEVLRESVTLRELQGFSYQEIAEIQGVPIGTVRSRIARAREQLAQELEAWKD